MSQQRVWRGVYWTLGSALQFKADPLCRVVCKLTESCSRFPVCTASLYPQLNIFQSELVGLRQTYRCIMGNMDILWAVNLTSALATSIEAWMSADVPTWPKTLPWLLTTGKEQKHYSTAPRFFLHKLNKFTQVEVLDSNPVCVCRLLNIYDSLDTMP